MERFTKLQAWIVTFIGILSLCGMLALWDCYSSSIDNRPITPFTTWVIVFVLAEHAAMLVGAFMLQKHAPELTELRRASADNIGLKTRVMFLEQDNTRMLTTIRAMEGRVAPVTAFQQNAKRQDRHQQSRQAQHAGT